MTSNFTSTKKGTGRVHRDGTKKAGFWLNRGIAPPKTVITTISLCTARGKNVRKSK